MLTAFPSITPDEFKEACQIFEARCGDRLDGTQWRSVRFMGEELRIQIKFRVGMNKKEDKDVSGNGNTEDEIQDYELEENEDDINGTLRKRPGEENQEDDHHLMVDYSIVLSPSYCVPVLWFSCRYSERMIHSIDEVYHLLVPQNLHGALRDVSVMGGISMAYHPISDLPSFFIHPCNTPESLLALSNGQDLDPEDYLLLWIGLIGSSVGLFIPSKLLAKQE